jgi:hypothetical protein
LVSEKQGQAQYRFNKQGKQMKMRKTFITLVYFVVGIMWAAAASANSVGYRDLDGNKKNGVEAFFNGSITFHVIFKDASDCSSASGEFGSYQDCHFNTSKPIVANTQNLVGVNYGGLKTWDEASEWAANLNIGGVSGWKLGSPDNAWCCNYDWKSIWWEGEELGPDTALAGGIAEAFIGGTPSMPKTEKLFAYAYHDGDVGTAPAVPLPATFPLMLSALGALGVVTRRRPGCSSGTN